MRAGPIKMRINRLFADYNPAKTKSRKPGNRSVSPQLLERASRGDTAAQYRLGCCYADGDDVAQDLITGRLWLQKAAEAGYVPAMVRLGKAYLDGDRLDRNRVRGLFWLLKAANRNNRDACAFLGSGYALERFHPNSDRYAAKWFQKAANLGCISSMIGLGRCYENGSGIEQDTVKAYVCYSVATLRNGSHIGLMSVKMKRDGMSDEQIAEILRLSHAANNSSALNF